MITIALDDATNRLGTLLEEVEEHGEVVLVCRSDRPVAESRPAQRLTMPPMLSKVTFNEEPRAPLDAEDGMGVGISVLTHLWIP